MARPITIKHQVFAVVDWTSVNSSTRTRTFILKVELDLEKIRKTKRARE